MSEEEKEKEELLVITEENFDQYFFDVRRHEPQRGQVMACYTAKAEFLDGMEKRNIMSMLQGDGKIEAVMQIMRKLLHANEKDSIRIPREMSELRKYANPSVVKLSAARTVVVCRNRAKFCSSITLGMNS